MKIQPFWKLSGMAFVLASTGSAQVTRLVSVSSGGTIGNIGSGSPSISGDGSYVVFQSAASNLVPGDTNLEQDAFFRAWRIGSTELVSVDSNEVLANDISQPPEISADGLKIAFESDAINLVSGDTNAASDIFVRNRASGTTQRASLASTFVQGNGSSTSPSISADGRYVAFASAATNLVLGDTNSFTDVFVRDMQTGITERVSFSTAGAQANGNCTQPSISANGRYVAFVSVATNLVSGDSNGVSDIFLRDRLSYATQRVSVSMGGVQGNGVSDTPSISANGSHVAFLSYATNLVAGDTNGVRDVFHRDWTSNSNEIVSVDSNEVLANTFSGPPSISADGRLVAFDSNATNLVPGDTNGTSDIFVRNLSLGTTERVNVSSSGAQANYMSLHATISADGRYVAFASVAFNLVPGDTNGYSDVFLRDLDATGFTSLCEPGAGGVIACPCSNPPTQPGRGCNNSSATGGAILSASGIAYLSMDSLVFTTFGEKPTALSIVLQGTAVASSGLVYGQGVRCVGGALERIFTRNAASGSIVVPDFGAGDPTISARSASLGDLIQPGQSRWYLVYYRDGTVLGGCPATSNFNTTQTGRVSWSP